MCCQVIGINMQAGVMFLMLPLFAFLCLARVVFLLASRTLRALDLGTGGKGVILMCRLSYGRYVVSFCVFLCSCDVVGGRGGGDELVEEVLSAVVVVVEVAAIEASSALFSRIMARIRGRNSFCGAIRVIRYRAQLLPVNSPKAGI